MVDSFAADCPVCGETVVVTSITASCGRCAVIAGATDAREQWDNVQAL